MVTKSDDNGGPVERAEILPLLGPVRKQGKDIFAFCPVHGDGQKHNGKGGQSLVLHDSGVLKCYAGCKFADVMKALRERSGVKRAPSPAPRRQEKAAAPGQWPKDPVVAYEYHAADGELIAVKARFEAPNPDGGKPLKRFQWRLPSGTYAEGFGGQLHMVDIPLWGQIRSSRLTRPCRSGSRKARKPAKR